MHSNKQSDIPRPRYIPVPDWHKHHLWPSTAGLRNLIFNRHRNDFNKVLKKVGKRILIEEIAFFEWVASQGEK